jgi:protein archease
VPPDRGYEVLEHTADVGLRVWAPDFGALFEEAALALIAIMGTATGAETRREEVNLEAPDGVALLVDWLSEVLFLFDARGLVPLHIEAYVEPWHLRATMTGCDAEHFQQGGAAVKAVTYHDAMLRETDSGWEARIYLDV